MSEWGIALIAAGSAILGSITTGFFAWRAGHRQAAAAEAAGQAQAQALISTVQATLDEQRQASVHSIIHPPPGMAETTGVESSYRAANFPMSSARVSPRGPTTRGCPSLSQAITGRLAVCRPSASL